MADRLYPRARQTGWRRFEAWLVDGMAMLVWSCPHKHTKEWEAWYCAFEALRLKEVAFEAKEASGG